MHERRFHPSASFFSIVLCRAYTASIHPPFPVCLSLVLPTKLVAEKVLIVSLGTEAAGE